MHSIDPFHVQLLSALLFGLGLVVVLTRRNIFLVLMGVEVMLNAVNLSFVGFSQQLPGAQSLWGQLTPLFTIAIAAAEACVGLAMVICITRGKDTVDSDQFAEMKE
ncbi:MAG: NADH-quinone oxidoreductase subunit NuoK [Planctomycetes bacterium]|nr:NADH-quinone oxidoreductase subunit NuoK [Planctomycetota bacterium]